MSVTSACKSAQDLVEVNTAGICPNSIDVPNLRNLSVTSPPHGSNMRLIESRPGALLSCACPVCKLIFKLRSGEIWSLTLWPVKRAKLSHKALAEAQISDQDLHEAEEAVGAAQAQQCCQGIGAVREDQDLVHVRDEGIPVVDPGEWLIWHRHFQELAERLPALLRSPVEMSMGNQVEPTLPTQKKTAETEQLIGPYVTGNPSQKTSQASLAWATATWEFPP